MFRNIAQFYLLAMGLAFAITLIAGAHGSPTSQIFLLAMLGWPMSALVLLGQKRLLQTNRPAPSDRGNSPIADLHRS